jgi:hypothetical protein
MTIRELFAIIDQAAHDAGQWFLNIDITGVFWAVVPFLLIWAFVWLVAKAVEIHERRQLERYQRQMEEEWGRLP